MTNYVQRDVFVRNAVNQRWPIFQALSLGEKRMLSFIHNRILFSTNVIDKFSLVVYIYMANSFS